MERIDIGAGGWKVGREAELVSSEKRGQFVIYSINVSVLQEVLGDFLDLFYKK